MHFRNHKGEALRIHIASYLVQRKKMALFIDEHSGETVDDEGAADILLIDKNCDAGRETIAKWGAPKGRTIVLHYPWFIECRQMDKLMLEEDNFHGYRLTRATERARPTSPARRHVPPLPSPPASGRSRHPTESTPSSPSSASQPGLPPTTSSSAQSIPTPLPQLAALQTMTAEQLQQMQLQNAAMPMFNPMFPNIQIPGQIPTMQTNALAIPYIMSNPYQFQQFCMAMASQMPQMANFNMGFPMSFPSTTALPQTFPFFQQQTHAVPPHTAPASVPAVPPSSAKKASQKSRREDKHTDTRKAKRAKPISEVQAPASPQPGPSRGRSPSPVREVKKLFTADGNALLFLIESNVWHRSDLAASVRGHGGKVTNDVLEADYIVLSDRFDAKVLEPLLDEAEKLSIPLVKRSFIIASLNDENIVDLSHHKPISEKVLGKQRRISMSSLSDLTSMRSGEDEEEEEEIIFPTKTRRKNVAEQAAPPTPQRPAWARDLRTPPPPSNIIPGRYTEEEKEFAYETVRVRMTLDPTISQSSIAKELGKRDPNHSWRAWQQAMWSGTQSKAIMQKVMADAILDHEKRTGKDSNEGRPAKRPRVSQSTAGEELISDHACERDYEAIVQVFVDYGESIGDCDLESQWERIYAKIGRRCETEEDWSVFYDKHDEEILRRFEIRKQQHI